MDFAEERRFSDWNCSPRDFNKFTTEWISRSHHHRQLHFSTTKTTTLEIAIVLLFTSTNAHQSTSGDNSPQKNEAVHLFSSDRSNFGTMCLRLFITHNQQSLALIARPGIGSGEAIVTPPQNFTAPRDQQHWDRPLESKFLEQHEPHRHQTGHRANTLDSGNSSNLQTSSSAANDLAKWVLTTDWGFRIVWICRPWWIRHSGKLWGERQAPPW